MSCLDVKWEFGETNIMPRVVEYYFDPFKPLDSHFRCYHLWCKDLAWAISTHALFAVRKVFAIEDLTAAPTRVTIPFRTNACTWTALIVLPAFHPSTGAIVLGKPAPFAIFAALLPARALIAAIVLRTSSTSLGRLVEDIGRITTTASVILWSRKYREVRSPICDNISKCIGGGGEHTSGLKSKVESCKIDADIFHVDESGWLFSDM
jgi:hypothetical protein